MSGSAPASITQDAALATLGDEIVSLLSARKLEDAKALLECVLSAGTAPAMMLVAYAVCLAELGEDDRASEVGALLDTIDDPTLAKSGLLAQAKAWLPGGALCRTKRDSLQGDAERWLPRGKKGKK